MLFLIVFAIMAFLIWVEIIPVRKWVYEIRVKTIGVKSRCWIEFISFLDKIDKCIEWLLE